MSQKELWTCADGRVIAVEDMTEQHAKNCLNLLLKRSREARERTLQVVFTGAISKEVKNIVTDYESHDQDTL